MPGRWQRLAHFPRLPAVGRVDRRRIHRRPHQVIRVGGRHRDIAGHARRRAAKRPPGEPVVGAEPGLGRGGIRFIPSHEGNVLGMLRAVSDRIALRHPVELRDGGRGRGVAAGVAEANHVHRNADQVGSWRVRAGQSDERRRLHALDAQFLEVAHPPEPGGLWRRVVFGRDHSVAVGLEKAPRLHRIDGHGAIAPVRRFGCIDAGRVRPVVGGLVSRAADGEPGPGVAPIGGTVDGLVMVGAHH